MLDIDIKTVPDRSQRYNTVGDYRRKNKKDIIRVSNMNNWKYEVLVAVHEIIEQFLCRSRGINEDAITAFDQHFEKRRNHFLLDEPGNDPDAPYYKEHQFALKIEKLFAQELGVDWNEYNKVIAKLDSV